MKEKLEYYTGNAALGLSSSPEGKWVDGLFVLAEDGSRWVADPHDDLSDGAGVVWLKPA